MKNVFDYMKNLACHLFNCGTHLRNNEGERSALHIFLAPD